MRYVVTTILMITLCISAPFTYPETFDDAASSDNKGLPPYVILNSPVSTFPYLQDFETGPGDWNSGGANSTWAFGTPAKSIINGAASGIHAWVNGGLTDTYSNEEDSYVETQHGFDFTNIMFPMVRFKAWWSTESSFDNASLHISTDDGATWQRVGSYGDPYNWYNDIDQGWSGESGGYVTVAHELQAYAGQPSVKFRIQFSSDFSITQNGFAFDEFEIFNNFPQVNVTNACPPGMTSIPPGITNALTQTLRFDATGNIATNIDSITVKRTGTILDSDIQGVRLWLDNGDGVFRSIDDTSIAIDTSSGSITNFSGLSAFLALQPLQPSWVHIAYDLATTATPGDTFGSKIENASDIVSSTSVPVVLVGEPLSGDLLTVLEVVGLLPFADDFGPSTSNRTTETRYGVIYPSAASVGPLVVPSPSPSPNTGQVQLVEQVDDGAGGLISPLSPPHMAALSSPNGSAASALEYWFDLSGYSINDDLLWLMFSWNNANMNDHDLNNVFISTDARATWASSVFRFDFTAPVPPGWHDEVVDISTSLVFSGTDYSATTVVRFQAFGLSDFGEDGLAIDNVWLGIPQHAYIERNPGISLPSGTIDGAYGMGTGPITLTYTLTNPAHLPLTLGDIMVSDETGLTGMTLTPSSLPSTMDPGDSISFDVSFGATDPNFSFLLSFPTNDPRVTGGVYSLTVIGEHEPRIAVERQAGVQITNGGVDDIGQHFAGQLGVLNYTIFNNGTRELLLTDIPDPVSIINNSNVLTFVTSQPELVEIPASAMVSFDVSYFVPQADDFQFDITLGNNVSSQDPYTVTVIGSAATGALDAGPVVSPDAGEGQPDAGPTAPDAGTTEPPVNDGCSCHSYRPMRMPSPILFIVLVAFAMFYQRRGRFHHYVMAGEYTRE